MQTLPMAQRHFAFPLVATDVLINERSLVRTKSASASRMATLHLVWACH